MKKRCRRCGSVESFKVEISEVEDPPGTGGGLLHTMPTKTAKIKEKDRQTAAMLSLAVQSRFDVRFIFAPGLAEGVIPLSEWRGKLSNLREPEKRRRELERGRTRTLFFNFLILLKSTIVYLCYIVAFLSLINQIKAFLNS